MVDTNRGPETSLCGIEMVVYGIICQKIFDVPHGHIYDHIYIYMYGYICIMYMYVYIYT